jgi:hypothetical protein
VILDRASDTIPDDTSGLGTALSRRQVPCYVKGNDGSLHVLTAVEITNAL